MNPAGLPSRRLQPRDTMANVTNLADSAFLRACRQESVPHTPIWFMRQAGRSLPEYRAARANTAMLEACMTPDLVVEITLQPLRRYAVDAAIFFSDIVIPLVASGVALSIQPNVGPVIEQPIRDAAAIDALPELHPEQLPYVTQAVSGLVKELSTTPLIGFAGAPFTLASYLIEGGPSKSYARTKAMMYGEPELWHRLMAKLSQLSLTFLQTQVAAGASAVQLFDSWVGAVAPDDYRTFIAPHTRNVLAGIGELNVPRIHFGINSGELLGDMAAVGADVVGVDWRVPLDDAAQRTGKGVALQGNLDPAVLLAPVPVIHERASDVLRRAKGLAGHIFNLGHGVLPSTPPDNLARLADYVHEQSATV